MVQIMTQNQILRALTQGLQDHVLRELRKIWELNYRVQERLGWQSHVSSKASDN